MAVDQPCMFQKHYPHSKGGKNNEITIPILIITKRKSFALLSFITRKMKQGMNPTCKKFDTKWFLKGGAKALLFFLRFSRKYILKMTLIFIEKRRL